MELMKLIAYTDGASRGNPGQAGIGVAIYNEKNEKLKSISQYIGEATNNVAEYKALISALQASQELGAEEIEVFTDSELMVKQIKGEYRVKNEGLKPLFNEAKELIKTFTTVKVTHVRRELNKEADKLANIAIDSQG